MDAEISPLLSQVQNLIQNIAERGGDTTQINAKYAKAQDCWRENHYVNLSAKPLLASLNESLVEALAHWDEITKMFSKANATIDTLRQEGRNRELLMSNADYTKVVDAWAESQNEDKHGTAHLGTSLTEANHSWHKSPDYLTVRKFLFSLIQVMEHWDQIKNMFAKASACIEEAEYQNSTEAMKTKYLHAKDAWRRCEYPRTRLLLQDILNTVAAIPEPTLLAILSLILLQILQQHKSKC